MLIEKRFMEEAFAEAKAAAAMDETPVGAVIVRNGEIIARAHNMVETLHDASAHAELIAMRKAAEALDSRILSDCVLYVTMEPCPMCAGACLHFRIGAVAYGAYDKACGAAGSVTDLGCGLFGPEIPFYGGIMQEECARLLTDFFKGKRQ